MENYKNSKVDFAAHHIETDKLLRRINDKLVKNQYGEAVDLVNQAVAELRLMKAAINTHVRT
jgi:major membrane immunogen (membrane-anchored lipoprotein)